MTVEFDYSMLRGKIKEIYGTETEFAKKLGISAVSLGSKLNNKTGFKNNEINAACNLLHIDIADAGKFFLRPKR